MKKILLALALLSSGLFADAIGGAVEKQSLNLNAIIMFFIFVLATLGITYWAAKRTKTAKDFYAAGGGISGKQNGLAIAGDFMSAASFLGISGLVYTSGFDGLIYSIGFLVGWPIILFLIAEPLRNLGKFTFADVASFRLRQGDIRTIAATGTIVTVIFYLIAQMVGAGKLIQLLFGLEYSTAVLLVGVLMVLYVAFGGMLATTWIQIIKAVLLLSGATFIAFMVMKYFGFSMENMFKAATTVHAKHTTIMEPGGLVSDPWNAISLGLALMFGTAGLPHILMRFFTVADAKEARKSVFYATGLIGYFYVLTFIIGFGAITLLALNPEYFTKGIPALVSLIDGKYVIDANVSTAVASAYEAGAPLHTMIVSEANQTIIAGTNAIHGGNNMTAIHLSKEVGGDLFLGFISAVAFATILAVVSGLTLSGASAISHDLYASVIGKGKVNEATEMKASRVATLVLGIIAIVLGIAFEKQNVAYMVGLAFAIAASVNFPILILSIYWRGLTTRGAFIGGFVGLFSAIALVIMGPAVWKDVMGNKEALISLKNPAIISMTLTFIVTYLVSKMDSSARAKEDQAGFDAQFIRAQTGIGAEGASEH